MPSAQAFTASISAGTRAVYLQVGAGTMAGGNFSSGGTPGNNAIVNTASVSVPAAALGTGVAQPMSTNSTVSASAFDSYPFCSSPATTGQVYVGGFYRAPGISGAASSLTVTTTPNLSNGAGDTIPFSSIAWVSSGNGDTASTIPSGAFTGGTQTLVPVARNTWFESCLAFRYLNTRLVPGGTFTGRAIYTLSTP